MEFSRALMNLERVVHALRVTSEAAARPAGVRAIIDTWLSTQASRGGGERLTRAAKAVATAGDAAPLACTAVAVRSGTQGNGPRPAVFAACAVGVPLVAPALIARLGGPSLPADLRHSLVDGATFAALAGLGPLGAAPASAGALVTGAARVRLGATPSAVAAGTVTGWGWARLAELAIRPLAAPKHLPPPVEIDEYRDRRAEANP